MKFNEGDYVKIVTREQTSADVKNGTFYPYFCGLAGVVERVYDDAVSLKVDCNSLPDGVLKRHLEIQESVKQKWLNGLSGEARNRLTPQEKRFELAYTILVQTTDLEKSAPGEVKAKPALNKEGASEAELPSAKAVTSKDLEDAEKAFLKQREQALKEN